jgi:hypothetical protein
VVSVICASLATGVPTPGVMSMTWLTWSFVQGTVPLASGTPQGTILLGAKLFKPLSRKVFLAATSDCPLTSGIATVPVSSPPPPLKDPDSHMISSTAPSTNTAASAARIMRRRRLAFGSSSSGASYSS